MLTGRIRYNSRNIGFRETMLVLVLQVEVKVGDELLWRDATVADLTVSAMPPTVGLKHG